MAVTGYRFYTCIPWFEGEGVKLRKRLDGQEWLIFGGESVFSYKFYILVLYQCQLRYFSLNVFNLCYFINIFNKSVYKVTQVSVKIFKNIYFSFAFKLNYKKKML